jgi:uncharacterized protein YdeI (BOF family)
MMKKFALAIAMTLFFAMSVSAQSNAGMFNPGTEDHALAFTVSPNPAAATSEITVNFNLNASQSGQVSLSITNLIGQSLYAHMVQAGDIQNKLVKIDLADLKLSKGLYFVKMSSGEYCFTQKLVIR